MREDGASVIYNLQGVYEKPLSESEIHSTFPIFQAQLSKSAKGNVCSQFLQSCKVQRKGDIDCVCTNSDSRMMESAIIRTINEA